MTALRHARILISAFRGFPLSAFRFPLFLILLLPFAAGSMTVTGVVQQVTGLAYSNAPVSFSPTNRVLVGGSGLVAGDLRSVKATNGAFRIGLLTGAYAVEIPPRLPFVIQVTNDDPAIVINITNLITTGALFQTGTNPIYSVVSGLRAGTNTTLTTNGQVITIHATGGSGSGFSTNVPNLQVTNTFVIGAGSNAVTFASPTTGNGVVAAADASLSLSNLTATSISLGGDTRTNWPFVDTNHVVGAATLIKTNGTSTEFLGTNALNLAVAFSNALANATFGDQIRLSPGLFLSGSNAFVVPAGVSVVGSGRSTILSKAYASTGTNLNVVYVNKPASLSDLCISNSAPVSPTVFDRAIAHDATNSGSTIDLNRVTVFSDSDGFNSPLEGAVLTLRECDWTGKYDTINIGSGGGVFGGVCRIYDSTLRCVGGSATAQNHARAAVASDFGVLEIYNSRIICFGTSADTVFTTGVGTSDSGVARLYNTSIIYSNTVANTYGVHQDGSGVELYNCSIRALGTVTNDFYDTGQYPMTNHLDYVNSMGERAGLTRNVTHYMAGGFYITGEGDLFVGDVTAIGLAGNGRNITNLNAENIPSPIFTNNLLTGLGLHGNTNSYTQIKVKNFSNGSDASSDFVAEADNGSESSYYINFGINGSGYVPTPALYPGRTNDAYINVYGNAANSNWNGGNFYITTAQSNAVIGFYLGSSNATMTLSNQSAVFNGSVRLPSLTNQSLVTALSYGVNTNYGSLALVNSTGTTNGAGRFDSNRVELVGTGAKLVIGGATLDNPIGSATVLQASGGWFLPDNLRYQVAYNSMIDYRSGSTVSSGDSVATERASNVLAGVYLQVGNGNKSNVTNDTRLRSLVASNLVSFAGITQQQREFTNIFNITAITNGMMPYGGTLALSNLVWLKVVWSNGTVFINPL